MLQNDVAKHVRIFAKHFPKTVNSISVERMSRYIRDVVKEKEKELAQLAAITTEVQRLWSLRAHVQNMCKTNRGVPQRTPPWYAIRKLGLTASDLAQANDEGDFGNRKQLLLKKLGVVPDNMSAFGSEIMGHGTMFEDMALRGYQARNDDVPVHDFGLLIHKDIPRFGASPDGITEWGRMVEIKCPPKRVMNGTIKRQYLIQMQAQMAVTGLTETDFVEAKIEVLNTAEFLALPDEPTTDAGVGLHFVKDDVAEYAFSPNHMTPKEAHAWAMAEGERRQREDPDLRLVRIAPWQLTKMDIMFVPFDAEMWATYLPVIHSFLDDMSAGAERIALGQPPWDGYAKKEPKEYKRKRPKIDFEEDSDDACNGAC